MSFRIQTSKDFWRALQYVLNTTTSQEIQGTVPCSFPQHKNITAVLSTKAPSKDRFSDNSKKYDTKSFFDTDNIEIL